MLDIIVETLVASQAVSIVANALLYRRKKHKSIQAVARKLRDRGFTTGFIANVFNVHSSTINKILREAYDGKEVPGFSEDRVQDWLLRHEEWCRKNDKHIEETTFGCNCSECKSKEKVRVADNQIEVLNDLSDNLNSLPDSFDIDGQPIYHDRNQCGGCGRWIRHSGICDTCRYYEHSYRYESGGRDDDDLGPLR